MRARRSATRSATGRDASRYAHDVILMRLSVIASEARICSCVTLLLPVGANGVTQQQILRCAQDDSIRDDDSVPRILRILRPDDHAVDLRLRNRTKRVLERDVRRRVRVELLHAVDEVLRARTRRSYQRVNSPASSRSRSSMM